MPGGASAAIAASAGLAVAAYFYYRTAKRLLEEHASLVEHQSELLCEARLLALELNKEGDPLAIVQDPLLPTKTIERMVSAQATEDRKSELRTSKDLWKRAAVNLFNGAFKAQGKMRPMAIRQVLSSTAPGQIPTKVIGVCGMSCSGKSTVSSVLRAHAATHRAHVPVICLDDSFYEWMFDEPASGQPTSFEPPGGGGRLWKNWESRLCINWRHFVSKLRAKIAVHSGYTPYIVVEGFLLLEDVEAMRMVDHVVSIEVSKEVAWQRRLSRALAMAKGSKDASGMDNYERLAVYAPRYALERDFARIHADAAAAVARLGAREVFPRRGDAAARTATDLSEAAGAYDWLRLYFEEVIWPESRAVQRRVEEVGRRTSGKVWHVDGDQSAAEVETATRRIIAEIFHE